MEDGSATSMAVMPPRMSPTMLFPTTLLPTGFLFVAMYFPLLSRSVLPGSVLPERFELAFTARAIISAIGVIVERHGISGAIWRASEWIGMAVIRVVGGVEDHTAVENR